MHFLLSNDDGIEAEGLLHLARAAARFGKVTIVAPSAQCSAMSQHITIRTPMRLEPVEYPVEGVTAWKLDGTPADCVKVALHFLLKEKPNYVFSGLNHGWNSGFDTCYSGTVAAALEGLMEGVPSAAFSTAFPLSFETTDAFLDETIRMILEGANTPNEIWNVNFPGCPPGQCAGILKDVVPASFQVFADVVTGEKTEDGSWLVMETGLPENPERFVPGTDIYGLFHNYVTVGKLNCPVL